MKSCILVTYFDEDSLSEAKGLCNSAEYKILHIIKQSFLNHGKFGLSGGKINDLKNLVTKMHPDVIVFDEVMKPVSYTHLTLPTKA